MRRTYAALLCFAWLLAIEVLPNVHLAAHDRPHTHAVDGTVIVVSFDRDAEPHRHADGTVHSHAAIAKREAKRAKRGVATDHAISHAPDTHVAAGLAHHATALLASTPPLVALARIDRVEHELASRETGRAHVALVATRDARGPPSA